jgi:hypothetical protein
MGVGAVWIISFIERLWRSLKYEEVYLRGYAFAIRAQSPRMTGMTNDS